MHKMTWKLWLVIINLSRIVYVQRKWFVEDDFPSRRRRTISGLRHSRSSHAPTSVANRNRK